MKVLVIGSGGREHALIWKLSRSSKVTKIFAAPGNGGIDGLAECIDIKAADINALLEFALENKIDLTVVGPEAPLVAGLADVFRSNGLLVFGPDKAGARIEGSKDFCRSVCLEAGVKIAEGRTFACYDEARLCLEKHKMPVVIKADGLAEGKGVIIAESFSEAQNALKLMMLDKKFGDAGVKVVIEEFLTGYEISILAVCSGVEALVLEPSQDHKRIYDGDTGPNTGGMGAYSPVPAFSPADKAGVKENIILPVLKVLRNMGVDYRGVLYAGLMVVGPSDFRVLEFNARFGDPETQAVLPRLESDLFELFYSAARGKSLENYSLRWSSNACVAVVAASSGYPGSYRKGFQIKGLTVKTDPDRNIIFHAGTIKKNGAVLTSGGRVLAVSSLGRDFNEAKNNSYSVMKNIDFKGIYYRRDISDKAINS